MDLAFAQKILLLPCFFALSQPKVHQNDFLSTVQDAARLVNGIMSDYHRHADPRHSHDRQLHTRMARHTGESLRSSIDPQAHLDAEALHMQTHSTFAGDDNRSEDSLSSTAEAVMELQPGRRLSLEGKYESRDVQDAVRQGSTEYETGNEHASAGKAVPGPGSDAAAHTGFASESDEELMAAQLSKLPAKPTTARQQSPAPWPMRRVPKVESSEEDEGTETEDLEEEDQEDGNETGEEEEEDDDEGASVIIAEDEPGDATGWGDLAGDGAEDDGEEGSDFDEALLLSQLTKGVKPEPAGVADSGESSEIEEMNEELSDYDEDSIMAQLTKKR